MIGQRLNDEGVSDGRLPTAADIDGVSLVDLFKGEGEPDRDGLLWHFPYYHPEATENPDTEPQSAIRIGDWKLIRYYDSERSELYDLSEDLSEQKDLSELLPEKARELEAELEARLKSASARFPTLNR